ncbi:MAG: hypothetical protein KatS3mg026_1409 [Bacteroidia bacterium]|nr:MAG: hypothetical protein KatS3mg026_1409 [Bacteroidia bacterium]
MSWQELREHIIKPYGYLLRQTWYWVVGAGILLRRLSSHLAVLPTG